LNQSDLAVGARTRPGGDDAPEAPPLIAHVLFHLDIGGLENGVVNLINNMPRHAYRHAVVCVKGATDFRRRITRDDVQIVTLGKRDGFDAGTYVRAWRAFRELRPAIVHTRNLAALEMQIPAALAGVGARVHSEHGLDGRDLAGRYRRYNLIRKAFRPFVHRYVALSKDLERWMTETLAIDPARLEQIYNGVDTGRFAPADSRHAEPSDVPSGFFGGDATFVIGAVGRMVPIKDHETLVRAFALLHAQAGDRAAGLRLVVVGGGPRKDACAALARELGVAERCWFAGDRTDVDALLRKMDVFCLTSLNEGINNTLLEAMSSALPIAATAVGGNVELIVDGRNGRLVPAQAPAALAAVLAQYLADPALRRQHGEAGRRRVEAEFSLQSMVARYARLYDTLLGRRAPVAAA
jgi:sugar transferase (PEP-CTERM/EpsH1 system associated)